ncbi:TetR/AcrR family transcriptional regulator [Burkholderia seminalis]|uniref:TetR/AcrR family transcriptional regulator n=1 Tax=Burkholderia seminalis TaxID=488731 RepID=UPI0015889233|nr:TetR/AcrR family transcriptional regulator [Burkholderia seminalis]
MTVSTRPYHHGNLKETVLSLAFDAVEQAGHETLSIRDIAAAAGVTPMAIYRHFSNRTSLLAAVAGMAFRQLYESHVRVVRNCATPWEKLDKTMRVFITFVDRHPNLFRLMFDPSVASPEEFQHEFYWQQKAYDSILGLFVEAQPDLDQKAIRLRQLSMWSSLFGYATARTTGTLKHYMLEGVSRKEIVDSIVRTAIGPRAQA